jgi:hypothetical protein
MKISSLYEAKALIEKARSAKSHKGLTAPFPKSVKDEIVRYTLDDSCPYSMSKVAAHCGLKNVLPKWISQVTNKPQNIKKTSKSCSIVDALESEKRLLAEKINLIRQCEALKLKVVK